MGPSAEDEDAEGEAMEERCSTAPSRDFKTGTLASTASWQGGSVPSQRT
jgi:hypothetical protein